MANKTPTFPGARTGRGQVLAVLLSNRDQSGAEPLQGRDMLAVQIFGPEPRGKGAMPIDQRDGVAGPPEQVGGKRAG